MEWPEQIDGVILRWTARRWHRLIVRVLCRAHAEGVITSRQLRILTRAFDPTVVDSGIADPRPAQAFRKDVGLSIVRRDGQG